MLDAAACAAACASLANVCQTAQCDARTGACRVSAAREGEACLEGNACGPAQCHSGECLAREPAPCPQLDTACDVGVCEPERGECVARPRRAAGGSCEQAIPLAAVGLDRAQAAIACSAQAPGVAGCTQGLTGTSAHFELDLRGQSAPSVVNLVVDASFAFEAALTRGPCSDPALMYCAEPFYDDGRSRRISAELEPDLYHLVVTAADAHAQGNVHVASRVGELACSESPEHDACERPLPIDLSLGQQSLFVNTGCATPTLADRCEFLSGSRDVFYALDLSKQVAETMLDIELAGGVASLFAASSATCRLPLACGERFSLRVPPGVYTLGVAEGIGLGAGEPIALRVGLNDGDCTATTNDRWDTATDLDPTLATQRIEGNTACAQNDFAIACNDDRGAPDLFYRLDLRGRAAPTSAHVIGNSAYGLMSYVLATRSDASAGDVTACAGLDDFYLEDHFYLAPRLYYLVIDGYAQSAGRFDLELRLTDAYAVPLGCYPSEGAYGERVHQDCLTESEPACATSLAHPDCLQAMVDCGLSPAVYTSFCAATPGCCDGALPPESCLDAWLAASSCPD
jgi:hypothetical protein